MDEEATRREQGQFELVDDKQEEESFQLDRRALEQKLAEGEDAELLLRYGYLHQVRGAALIREAMLLYERALELDPSLEKAHGQWILTNAMLLQHGGAIDRYKQRLAAAPESLAEYRFLAQAYLQAGEYEEADTVILAGLAIDSTDLLLLEGRGSVLSGQGHFEEALALWTRVFELDPERTISARYSRVFLLQRLGRLEDAAAEWEAIIEWLLARDYAEQAAWPKRELAGLRARINASDSDAEPGGGDDPGRRKPPR